MGVNWAYGCRLLSLAGLVLALSPPAQAATETSVAFFSDPYDWIGGGQTHLYHPGNGSISVGGSPSHVGVRVSGGTIGEEFSFDFTAPPGHAFTPGVYDGASGEWDLPGRPRIKINGGSHGCNR